MDVAPALTDTLSDPVSVVDVAPALTDTLSDPVSVGDVAPALTDTLSDPVAVAPVVPDALSDPVSVVDVAPALTDTLSDPVSVVDVAPVLTDTLSDPVSVVDVAPALTDTLSDPVSVVDVAPALTDTLSDPVSVVDVAPALTDTLSDPVSVVDVAPALTDTLSDPVSVVDVAPALTDTLSDPVSVVDVAPALTDTLSDPVSVGDVAPALTDALSDPVSVLPIDSLGTADIAAPLGAADALSDVPSIDVTGILSDLPSQGVSETLSDVASIDVNGAISDIPSVDVLPDAGDALSGAVVQAPGVSDMLGDVAQSAPLEDLAPVVSDTLGGVGETLGGGTDAAAALVDGALTSTIDAGSALTTSVDAGSALLDDAPAAIVAPFATTVAGASQDGLAGVVSDQSLDQFTLTLAPRPVTAGVESTSPASVDPGPAADGPHDPSPQQALADGAAVTAAPAAASAGVPEGVEPLIPASDPVAANPFADGASGLGGLGEAGSVPIAARGEFDPTIPAPTLDGSVAAAQPSAGGDSVLDIIAQAGQDTRLVASAAVLTLAGAALLGPRAGGSGADARMAFTNVRLLPCLLKEQASRQLTALTGTLAPIAAPAASGLGTGVGASGPAISPDSGSVKAERETGGLRGLMYEFSEGLSRATRDAGEAPDGLNDNRLAVQVGMLLGVVYLAFLSVWFWATRVRWNQRA